MDALHHLRVVCALLAAVRPIQASDKPPPDTNSAFDLYVKQAEPCIYRFGQSKPKDKELHIEPGDTGVCKEPRVSGGMVQNWRGRMFIAGATLKEVEGVLQDYNDYKKIYPEVMDSREISRSGNEFDVFLRLSEKYVITVVLNTAHHVRYDAPDDKHLSIISQSTRIAEVKNPKKSLTEEEPPNKAQGFLWRINNYWSIEAADGGVYVTCQAISLSRDVPPVIGPLIKPFLEQFPKDSMRNTLLNTQAEVVRRHGTLAELPHETGVRREDEHLQRVLTPTSPGLK